MAFLGGDRPEGTPGTGRMSALTTQRLNGLHPRRETLLESVVSARCLVLTCMLGALRMLVIVLAADRMPKDRRMLCTSGVVSCTHRRTLPARRIECGGGHHVSPTRPCWRKLSRIRENPFRTVPRLQLFRCCSFRHMSRAAPCRRAVPEARPHGGRTARERRQSGAQAMCERHKKPASARPATAGHCMVPCF